MVRDEGYHMVEGAPALPQPVYVAVHVRNRLSPVTRAMTRAVGLAFRGSMGR
jgi:hypothetical protein